jgi:hypothetical protein
MKSQEQITPPQQIDLKILELLNIQKLSEEQLVLLNAIQIKLKVDLSPQCTELGQYAGFMMDCRDKIIPQKIVSLIAFINAVNRIGALITPSADGNSLNRDEQKRWAE